MCQKLIKNTEKSRKNEQGAALAITLIIIAILAVICVAVLAVSSSEVRITESDLQRTQTFYATTLSIEQMTNNFSNLFKTKMNPNAADLQKIADTQPPGLAEEGFTFQQTLEEDSKTLAEIRKRQGLSGNAYPLVNITDGPFSGLYSTLVPYKITSTGTKTISGTQVKLEREFNNHLIPLFQFGIFSDYDLEFTPSQYLTFNGRIHSNGNIYAVRTLRFFNRVTAAKEFVRTVWKNGSFSNTDNVFFHINGIEVPSTIGSVMPSGLLPGGPDVAGTIQGERGNNPRNPQGVFNPNWESTSIQIPVAGDTDKFGGQLLTQSTGAVPLKLPLQLGGNSPIELIKRALPVDDEIISTSRYHNKAQIRILLDDENAGSGASNAAGIPADKGILLSQFVPMVLGSGSALRRVSDLGSYIDSSSIVQTMPISGTQTAMTVRGIKTIGETVGGNYIPPGSGVTGKILIEIIKPDGTKVDVTREILSLGITEGEPNSIVGLQRPLWTAYVQGSRDRFKNGLDLVSITRNSQAAADGEIDDPTSFIDSSSGLIKATQAAIDTETTVTRDAVPVGWQNQIVPINVYNVREGWFRNSLSLNDIYERGMTSIVEINMKNLARWVDGIYDANLLNGTNAVSTNIRDDDGYIVYISDRRGDKIKTERLQDGTTFLSTNGNVDNEDIYGPNNTLDEGEDVINFGWNADGSSKKGTLQKDTSELPDLGTTWTPTTPMRTRADLVLRWKNPSNYFRRAVRLVDGEKLSFSAATGKLSPTKGISVAAENMVYIWGSYNTTGVTQIPSESSTLNDGSYLGPQIPASIVCDAIFPLSKTWYDGVSALYPHGTTARNPDVNPGDVTQRTAVRTAIVAGNTITALKAFPGRDSSNNKYSGGMQNFPRFSERWNGNAWNYTGSIIPLYYSTQAISSWENSNDAIYLPPRRNWSFDSTFLNPAKLPPGTPFFQYIQATGFRQNIYN